MFYEPSEISAADKVTSASSGCKNPERAGFTPAEELELAMTLDPPSGRGIRRWIDPKLAAVYVVANEANSLCKVGYARELRKRVLSIRGSSPVPVHLCHFVHVVGTLLAKLVEADVHRVLGPERRHGEWFDVTPVEAATAIRLVVEHQGYVWWDEQGRRDLGFNAARLHGKDWARYSRRGRAHD